MNKKVRVPLASVTLTLSPFGVISMFNGDAPVADVWGDKGGTVCAAHTVDRATSAVAISISPNFPSIGTEVVEGVEDSIFSISLTWVWGTGPPTSDHDSANPSFPERARVGVNVLHRWNVTRARKVRRGKIRGLSGSVSWKWKCESNRFCTSSVAMKGRPG